MLAFPLVQIHAALDPADHGFIEAARGDLLRAEVLLDVKFEDCVEDIVFGEGVLIRLVGAELGAGGLGDRVPGDALAVAVDPF